MTVAVPGKNKGRLVNLAVLAVNFVIVFFQLFSSDSQDNHWSKKLLLRFGGSWEVGNAALESWWKTTHGEACDLHFSFTNQTLFYDYGNMLEGQNHNCTILRARWKDPPPEQRGSAGEEIIAKKNSNIKTTRAAAKVGVVTGLLRNTSICPACIMSKLRWTRVHGYELFFLNGYSEQMKAAVHPRSGFYAKVYGLQAVLPLFDMVLWVDSDAFVFHGEVAATDFVRLYSGVWSAIRRFNRSKKAEKTKEAEEAVHTPALPSLPDDEAVPSPTIPGAATQSQAPDHPTFLVWQNGSRWINNGAFIVYNNALGLKFLDAWWEGGLNPLFHNHPADQLAFQHATLKTLDPPYYRGEPCAKNITFAYNMCTRKAMAAAGVYTLDEVVEVPYPEQVGGGWMGKQLSTNTTLSKTPDGIEFHMLQCTWNPGAYATFEKGCRVGNPLFVHVGTPNFQQGWHDVHFGDYMAAVMSEEDIGSIWKNDDR